MPRRPFPEAAPPPEDNRVRHQGKVLPYHLTLGPEWEKMPANPDWDRSFQRGESLNLKVFAYKEKLDLKESVSNAVDKLRKQKEYDTVTADGGSENSKEREGSGTNTG